MNLAKFLNRHSAVEIKAGKSGADVYEIDGKYILKSGTRQKLKDDLFDSYTKEALFYRTAGRKPYLPKVFLAEASAKEFVILMKKYRRLERSTLDKDLTRRISRTLALLHTDKTAQCPVPNTKGVEPLTEEKRESCLLGWKSVLAEHPGLFDEAPLERIAKEINQIISWHNSEERVLTHGDCHWDNLLEDEKGNILLCDWQNVQLSGPSGDLSFLASRLAADGMRLNIADLLEHYATAVRELTGKQLDQRNILRHMKAANVIVSFVFWHKYLLGAAEEKVRSIYSSMINDDADANFGMLLY